MAEDERGSKGGVMVGGLWVDDHEKLRKKSISHGPT